MEAGFQDPALLTASLTWSRVRSSHRHISASLVLGLAPGDAHLGTAGGAM